MDNVGHSPLLRFLVKDTKIPTTMSEPEIKIQVAYDSNNIESNVPGTQSLRDDNHNLSQVETATGVDNTSKSETDADKADKSDREAESARVVEKKETTEVAAVGDFTLSPVITVTKKESVLTKGDLKVQKISVTEDISVRFQHLFRKQTTPGKTVVTQVQTLEYKY